MPTTLTGGRRRLALLAVVAVLTSLVGFAAPAGALVSNACPSTVPGSGFTDLAGVPTDGVDAIDCVKLYGITTGTTATTFSPFTTVERWQMALFLVRTAQDMGIPLGSGATGPFSDLAGVPADAVTAINQIFAAGISTGTSGSTFAPFEKVERWEMALFLIRLVDKDDDVTAPDGSSQGFTDLAGVPPAAVTAINQIKQLGVSTGTTATTFDPFGMVERWQMALFLARGLEVAKVTPPNLQVVVAPADTASLSVGQSRTYTATFKNTDGTPYTSTVGIQLIDTTSAGAPIYNDTTFTAPAVPTISAATDGLAGIGTTKVTGTAGTDGVVTFTINVAGGPEQVVPVAWLDVDGDLTYETVGNTPPTEPFGLGGVANFLPGVPGEATTALHTAFGVTKTIKASDKFEASLAATDCGNGAGAACTFEYDGNDIFQIGAAAATMTDFESALSVGDTVTANYQRDAANQSMFTLTDAVAPLTVSDPPAAGATVDALGYTVVGAADPGATVRVKTDLNNDGDAGDAGEGTVVSGLADVDGKWSLNAPLTQNAANNFVVTQQPVGGVESAPVNVPTITETPSGAAVLTAAVGANGGVAGILDPGDTVTLTFSKILSGVSSGDTISVRDGDGTIATLTLGPDVTFGLDATGTILTLTINTLPVISAAGTTAGIQPTAQVEAISGFIGIDGLAINVAGSGTGRVFTGF